jgi:hypothetical protein
MAAVSCWSVPVVFAAIEVLLLMTGYRLSHTHPVAAGLGVLLTAGLGGWYSALRRKGGLAAKRTLRLLTVVMLVVVFGGQYLVRNW